MEKEQILKDLTKNNPLLNDYTYWIITSPLTYPALVIHPKKEICDTDFNRFKNIHFEDSLVYQSDGYGGANKKTNLSNYTQLPNLELKTYDITYIFDCTNIGSIHKSIKCFKDNYKEKLNHEILLSRIKYNLHYEEPCIILETNYIDN